MRLKAHRMRRPWGRTKLKCPRQSAGTMSWVGNRPNDHCTTGRSRTLRAADGFRFRARGRDFAVLPLGLECRGSIPPGASRKLGKTSKMGQRDIRRLLVIGATAVIRWALAPAVRQRGSLVRRGCWNASRSRSWPSRWPTRWRVGSLRRCLTRGESLFAARPADRRLTLR